MNNLYELYKLLKDPKDNKDLSDKVNQLFVPYWHNVIEQSGESRVFYFIPRYTDNGTISPITIQQRVIMHAICIYLKDCINVNLDNLKNWMHFVWNIVENSYIDRDQAISAIRFFNSGLKALNTNYCEPIVCNIRQYLSSIDVNSIPKEIFGRRQLIEEIIKAKKCKEDCSFIEKIENAENSLFFKGAISFLFNNEIGEPIDWINFDRKLNRAKIIFDDNGLKEEYVVSTLCCLFSYCNNWDAQLWWSHKIFNGQSSTWKDNVLVYVDRNYSYSYALPVFHILMGDPPKNASDIEDNRIKKLSDHSLVDYIIKRNDNKRDMYIRWPYDVLYFCGDKNGVMLSNDNRDKTITELLKDDRFYLLSKSSQIPNTNMFWGFDIDFVFNYSDSIQYNLRWYREQNDQTYDIYIMDKDWNFLRRNDIRYEYTGDKQSFYCFNIDTQNGSSFVDQIIDNIKKEFNQ